MPWESKRLLSFDHYKSNDDYRDCCAAVYTEQLQAEESACPWTLSASHGLSRESFHGKPKRIWQGCYCWKLNTQFNLCQSQIYNVSWIHSLTKFLMWKLGHWLGMKGTWKLGMGTSGWTQTKRRISKLLCYFESHWPVQTGFFSCFWEDWHCGAGALTRGCLTFWRTTSSRTWITFQHALGLANFLSKDQAGNTVSFVGYVVSVTTTQLCYYSTKADLDNT